MSNLTSVTFSKEKCIGVAMIPDHDDGRMYARRVFCDGIQEGEPMYSIENVVFGLSYSELMEEISNTEFKVQIGSIYHEAIKTSDGIQYSVGSDYMDFDMDADRHISVFDRFDSMATNKRTDSDYEYAIQ